MGSVSWSKLTVVQPWFSALGHPAQSTLNLSRVVPRERVREFLIAPPSENPALQRMADRIRENVPTRIFRASGVNLRLNTMLAAASLGAGPKPRTDEPIAILFADADLIGICAMLGAGMMRKHPLICVVHLAGPEPTTAHVIKRSLVRNALRTRRLRVLLRSVELLDAWRGSYPEFSDAFRLFPPLEAVVSSPAAIQPAAGAGALRIGVIGQIRIGKCIPQLLRIAEKAGAVSVAVHGPLYQNQPEEFLRLMRGSPCVHAGFMTEEEMLRLAAGSDYLACLFEERQWDLRMESATFWLGVRAGRPVLCFGSGWIGRMARDTGCGIVVPGKEFDEHSLAAVPGRDQPEYERCLRSIERLRLELTPDALWSQLERSLA